MDLYLLLFEHYNCNENTENEEGESSNDMSDYCPGMNDTLADDLKKSEQEVRTKDREYPVGHPIFVRKGADLVEAEPGSEEAGFKRINGLLQKM